MTGPRGRTQHASEGLHREVKLQTRSGQQDLGHAFSRALSGVILGFPS